MIVAYFPTCVLFFGSRRGIGQGNVDTSPHSKWAIGSKKLKSSEREGIAFPFNLLSIRYTFVYHYRALRTLLFSHTQQQSPRISVREH